MRISKIILYDEPTVPEIQLEKIVKNLKRTFPVKIEIRDNFFKYSNKNIFGEIASTKIFDLKKPFKEHVPTQEEVLNERESKDESDRKEITPYDGFEFQKVITECVSANEVKINTLQIIFTNKLICTFEEDDLRYHARSLICSNPAIISTTGMIEGPAKPKQYYLDIMTNFSNQSVDEIKERYKGEYLEYHDSRLPDITEGYLLQAIMYYETGEAFCKHEYCRLFNAHWQRDLFYAQLKNKRFCKRHLKILEKLKS